MKEETDEMENSLIMRQLSYVYFPSNELVTNKNNNSDNISIYYLINSYTQRYTHSALFSHRHLNMSGNPLFSSKQVINHNFSVIHFSNTKILSCIVHVSLNYLFCSCAIRGHFCLDLEIFKFFLYQSLNII